MVQRLKTVRFDGECETRYVTAWISGVRHYITFNRSFGSLVESVSAIFQFGEKELRIYVLRFPGFSWPKKIRLTEENFNDYITKVGDFKNTSILYVCREDKSPVGSPATKKEDVGEGSQSSKGSNRSGQSEFSGAVLRRDRICVFCGSENGPREGAHILPYMQRQLLSDPSNRTKYGIDSINDTANGISLCRDCHLCFDANLVCIDPITGKLLITDALLVHRRDKWEKLVGHSVPVSTGQWPTKALLEFREDAMNAARKTRRENQEKFPFSCELCSKRCKSATGLKKHRKSCLSEGPTLSKMETPVKGTGAGEADDDSNFDVSDDEDNDDDDEDNNGNEVFTQVKKGPG